MRILDAQLVEAIATGSRAGPERGLAELAGQRVRRHARAVVDATRHEWTIRVTVDEGDDHLHTDPRNDHRTVTRSGPNLGDADPARGMFVIRAVAVAMELDPHAAELVGVDLVLNAADHHARLHAMDSRSGRSQGRTKGTLERDALEAIEVTMARRLWIAGLLGLVHDAD